MNWKLNKKLRGLFSRKTFISAVYTDAYINKLPFLWVVCAQTEDKEVSVKAYITDFYLTPSARLTVTYLILALNFNYSWLKRYSKNASSDLIFISDTLHKTFYPYYVCKQWDI